MKIENRVFNILICGMVIFISVFILTTACSSRNEKPKRTIQELLIEPERETIGEAKDRLEALDSYPDLLGDFELYGAILGAKGNLEKKIKIMEWEEKTERKTIQELLIEPEHETIGEAKDRLEALNLYPDLLGDFELYGAILGAKSNLEKKIKIMEWEENTGK
jgi:hypothetical protein